MKFLFAVNTIFSSFTSFIETSRMKVDQYISLTKLFTWRVEDDIQAMVGVQTAEIEPVHVGLQQPRQTGD